jgi:hypothetical protein
MGKSYPDRTNASGIWKINDIYKDRVKGPENSKYPDAGTRGITGGGSAPGTDTVIDFIQIMSTGNATDFGDLSVEGKMSGTASSHTRGVFGSRDANNVMDYITISSTGNATDFGNSTVANYGGSGLSNKIRGVFGGGYGPGSGNVDTDVMDFITIATTGNAADFGNLTAQKFYLGGMQNKTRGLFGGGYTIPAGNLNVIDVIEISTTGNASDFGDLTSAKLAGATMSGERKCIFAGGFIAALTKDIDVINPNSLGNASDFGELTVARKYAAGCSTYKRGVAMGGLLQPGNSNVIDFITFESAGTAVDFGDLTVARGHLGFNGISSGHGGLD